MYKTDSELSHGLHLEEGTTTYASQVEFPISKIPRIFLVFPMFVAFNEVSPQSVKKFHSVLLNRHGYASSFPL